MSRKGPEAARLVGRELGGRRIREKQLRRIGGADRYSIGEALTKAVRERHDSASSGRRPPPSSERLAAHAAGHRSSTFEHNPDRPRSWATPWPRDRERFTDWCVRATTRFDGRTAIGSGRVPAHLPKPRAALTCASTSSDGRRRSHSSRRCGVRCTGVTWSPRRRFVGWRAEHRLAALARTREAAPDMHRRGSPRSERSRGSRFAAVGKPAEGLAEGLELFECARRRCQVRVRGSAIRSAGSRGPTR